MRAEEVYNIAIHLPEKEMERLYAFIQNKINKNTKQKIKYTKPKLITDFEAREYLLKTVFRRN